VIVYLASPYSHPDATVRVERFEKVAKVAAKLMASGIHLYCPITHTHPIALAGDLPTGWDYWEQYDRKLLKACGELWVCMMPGWEESKGVTGEIAIARELRLPVRYINPETGNWERLEYPDEWRA
jgi:sugar phosphate isomerase/epimerase